MTHIPYVSGIAPKLLEMAFEDLSERFETDEVPGIVNCFAARPDVLWHFTPFAEALLLDPGHLTRLVREEIATFVSALNGSVHCLTVHSDRLRQVGGDPASVVAQAQGGIPAGNETAVRLLLEFIRKVTLHSRDISREDVFAARLAGWTDAQIAEAVLVAAYFSFMNRIANAFGVAPPEGLPAGPC